MKVIKIFIAVVIIAFCGFLFLENYTPTIDENHGKIQTRLYLGNSENQPLIVGFGGSEGGNAWDSDYWKPTRDKFIEKGYAFLAIGYFGSEDTSNNLDRISLDAIHDSIVKIAKNPKINSNKIAIIGGSKGGELVLNLASKYNNIKSVIAIIPSHVSFPALTALGLTSSWTFKGKEVPFVPIPYKAVPSLTSGELLKSFNVMLEDKIAEENSTIQVEKINGSIFLLSANNDEYWPSTKMSNKIMERLKNKKFKNHYEHITIKGGHTEPLKHFDLIYDFLDKNFQKK
ncbi:acyl-CoA thioester hydrolase/BAAT C-terminal domain-containing protein [Flavobacterium sp.]|uniref:acyl-CoA thioester hydrolase/BAAT C-terminal domain-containing protein n=1 Tax=Flavobacterium sp. TaxID=239 RepID=UPI002B4B6423|nr:acyl-CoA thioester hydrolase/BAAT C-terminal domain-containing protein [Flavobacterium sp.]HLF52905.1 acyl-CoA thioester hydrolase/BAAT C-terminal domain-containing protein [Flavobacterium sp.]